MYPYDNEYYCQTGATHGPFEENFIIRVVIVTYYLDVFSMFMFQKYLDKTYMDWFVGFISNKQIQK
jgi:hypothetical protein